MAGMTDILVIGAVLIAGYYIYTNPDILNQLTGGLGGSGGGEVEAPTAPTEDVSDDGAEAEAGPGESDIDVSGPGAGACANGVCKGDPEAIRRAEELLEEIQR